MGYLADILKKRNFYIIIFTVSIFGLAIIQYQYLRVGLNLAKVQFDIKMGLASETIQRDLISQNQLTFLIGKALEKDATYFTLSIDSVQDASSRFLNDIITERLVNNGIDLDFTYELHTRDTTYYLKSPTSFERDDTVVDYPIELSGYLPTLIGKRLILELKFKELNKYFLSKLNGLTLPSLLFILGIIGTVIWVLRTYYWQRNLITTTNEFINNLTHELKTPVFSIGLASKILEENAEKGQKPLIDIIRQEVKRLTEHIDKVLELGSLEANKKVFNLEKVDFRPYLLKLCEEFETLVSMEEVLFSYTLEPGKYWIMAEVFHLENTINNLLDNAKKYATNPQIQLEAKKTKKHMVIHITDNGKGIDEKDKRRIFQKYYRVPSGNLHQVKGYGLGLSYVKKVVRKLKGKIFIESAKGRGTTVSVSIPLCDD